jgi:hypothetical protein
MLATMWVWLLVKLPVPAVDPTHRIIVRIRDGLLFFHLQCRVCVVTDRVVIIVTIARLLLINLLLMLLGLIVVGFARSVGG